MTKSRLNILGLTTIIFIAGFLRLYRLDSVPPALYWDEASIGYNAFSILKAGIDEHGVSWPITHFLAYGDAKPPLYIYAVTLTMRLIGVCDLAVRLPSACAGILAVLITFFLTQTLFSSGKKPLSTTNVHSTQLALLTSFLLAISPWHLQMSRAGFEANLALTLFLAGILVFLHGLYRPKLLLLSGVFFTLTLYTFNAYRIFLPLFLISLGLIFRISLLKHWKYSFLTIILSCIITAPLIPFLLSPQARLRFNEVTILNNHQPILEANQRIKLNHNAIWSKIINNRRVLFALDFLAHYTDHFKPDFLFFSGDINPRLSVRDVGEMYLIELPLFLLGIYALLKLKTKSKLLLLAWFLLAPIPAGIARETPHALRILQLLPVPQILVALGILLLLQKVKHALPILIILYLIFFTSYLEIYYLHYHATWANSWQYGYKQLITYIAPLAPQYDRVYITQSLGRPHTYYLFYTQTDPLDYLANRNAGGDPYGFTYTYRYRNIYFSDPPEKGNSQEKWLVVSTQGSESADSLHTIYDLNNQPIFVIRQQ